MKEFGRIDDRGVSNGHGCHLTFLKAKSSKLGFFEMVCHKENDLTMFPFLALFNVEENGIFYMFLEKSGQNLQYYMKS
jgi:hypothetical protein